MCALYIGKKYLIEFLIGISEALLRAVMLMQGKSEIWNPIFCRLCNRHWTTSRIKQKSQCESYVCCEVVER